MKLGHWPAEYADGEKVLFAYRVAIDGYSEDKAARAVKEYVDYGYTSSMKCYQNFAEKLAQLGVGVNAGDSRNNALFGTPIDRSKANTDRMHEITVSMAKDTGKRDRETNAYNPAVVPIFLIKRSNGTYLTSAGNFTHKQEEAKAFFTRSEIESLYPNLEGAGWSIVEA